MSFLKTTAIQHLNGSNPAINFDASGNVGIGTTNTVTKLVVQGDNVPSVGQLSIRTTSANNYAQITFWDRNRSGLRIFQDYSDGSNPGVILNDSGSAIQMQNYIIKPNQPSFSAKATGSGPSASGTILFNEIDNNIGSHYSASTGRFTAPIAGRYLFSHFVLFSVGGTNASLSAQIRKNGAAAVHPYTRSTGADYVSTAGTVILSLSAGDYVTVYVDEGTIYATGAAHNNFSGFLIG